MISNFSVSQNFLNDKSLVSKIVTKASLSADNLILDIGAGEGIISEILLEKGFKVIAFEIDKNYFLKLEEKFKNNSNIKLINSDFNSYSVQNNLKVPYSIFSNIPFNQTTKLVQKILIENHSAKEVYLLMQEEAAYRFLGKKEGLLLSLLILNNYSSEIVYKFKKTDFHPVPKVNIVLTKFIKREKPLVDPVNYSKFLDFICYIVLQQKPSIIDRLSKTLNYYALKDLLHLLKIEPFNSLYEIPKLKYFEMFDLFSKKYSNKFEMFLGSFLKYQKINQSNKKIFQTRTK